MSAYGPGLGVLVVALLSADMRELLRVGGDAYCASLPCSSQSTFRPSSASWIAVCAIAVVGAAPCQCFTPGGVHTTSPSPISSTAPPHCWTRPVPAVTTSSCPSGCVCQAERAPGSNATAAADTRDDGVASRIGTTRTVP